MLTVYYGQQMRGVIGASANRQRQWQVKIIPLENNQSSMVVMETEDLLYLFWSWEHGKMIRKPHVITNTHADTRHKQKLHKQQEPNIAVAHFLTGLCLHF